MQRESRNPAGVRQRRATERAAVLHIAADRMAELCEMDADLIRAACFESAFEFGECPQRSDGLNVSHHPLSRLALPGTAAESVSPVTQELCFNPLSADVTWNDAMISAVGGVIGKLSNEPALRVTMKCEDKDATCFAIQALHGQQLGR